jgi:hypothetical protein
LIGNYAPFSLVIYLISASLSICKLNILVFSRIVINDWY